MIALAISLPILSAAVAFMTKKYSGMIALLFSSITFVAAVVLFAGRESGTSLLSLHSYLFSSGVFMAASLFVLLTCVYSLKYMEGHKRINEYYSYLLITLGAVAGVFFSSDYLTFLMFWGILGITLYMLIGINSPGSDEAARKAFVIVGGTDALMMMGIGLILALSRTLQIGLVPITLDNPLAAAAFLLMACGALAKAGAVPFNTWIPETALKAPASVTALLPASIDKLLGIYLLYRLMNGIFIVAPYSAASYLMLTIGAVTIISMTFSALVQHDLKKLLAYQAVAQVGYIILGIATCVPVGIAGGLFHMLNHAVYKSCLFFSAGSIEKETGTTNMEKLGNVIKYMPITSACAIIAGLSLAGVPPFSGFFSKWMIFQGTISLMDGSPLWIIWLSAAMFGSALTLASFIKIIYSVFLGRDTVPPLSAKETSWLMWAPMTVLAGLCVVFGIFAMQLPMPFFISKIVYDLHFQGTFTATLAAGLLLFGLLIGYIIYLLGNVSTTTKKPIYIGGEVLPEETIRVSGGEFYHTVSSVAPLKWLYSGSRKGLFDVYDLVSVSVNSISGFFSYIHDGFLGTYLTYILIGAILVLVMVAR